MNHFRIAIRYFQGESRRRLSRRSRMPVSTVESSIMETLKDFTPEVFVWVDPEKTHKENLEALRQHHVYIVSQLEVFAGTAGV